MPRPGKFLFAVDPGAQNDLTVGRSCDGGQDDCSLNRRRPA